MTKTIELTPEQTKAYNRFILIRDKIKKNRTRLSEISHSIDVAGLNHPLFVVNDDYIEYVNAFEAWLKIEPEFRNKERLRSSRGDYDSQDNWDEKQNKIKEL